MRTFLFGCIAVASFGHTARAAGVPPSGTLAPVWTAHGSGLLGRHPAVKASLTGRWGWLLNRLQPVLVDGRFRHDSTEVYSLRTPRESLTYHGPGGTKQVDRTPDGVAVSYNGRATTSADAKAAAALVADAYRMFLLGPQFFVERRATLAPLPGTRDLQGHTCRLLHTTLTPGLGFAPRDEVTLWVDADTNLIRRYAFTINGLSTTVGADVDVTVDGYVNRDGVEFATRYLEWVRNPVRLHAHRWRVVDLGWDVAAAR